MNTVANEQRAPRDYLVGTLSTAAAISDTTIQSAVFAGLPTTFSSTLYLPLILHDPSAGLYEVVWCTGHSGSSTSITVARGKEGSSARAWPAGTRVICAPTVRDVLSAGTLASLPSDAHIGARVAVTDKNYVAEKTFAGGWAPSVGVAIAEHTGPNRSGGNPPTSAAILVRAGVANLSANGSGQVSVSYRQAFPTATIAAVVMPISAGITFYSVASESASGFVAQAWRVTDLAPYTTTPMPAGHTVNIHYIAVGY